MDNIVYQEGILFSRSTFSKAKGFYI